MTKGYVVRGIGRLTGRTLYGAPFLYGETAYFTEGPQYVEHATLAAAIGSSRHARTSCRDVVILAVAEDGTETALPSYEQALAENERLRAVIVQANNALFDVLPLMDDPEHVIECHPDTLADTYRQLTAGVKPVVEMLAAVVLDMVEQPPRLLSHVAGDAAPDVPTLRR